jgi:hypothetical protein
MCHAQPRNNGPGQLRHIVTHPTSRLPVEPGYCNQATAMRWRPLSEHSLGKHEGRAEEVPGQAGGTINTSLSGRPRELDEVSTGAGAVTPIRGQSGSRSDPDARSELRRRTTTGDAFWAAPRADPPPAALADHPVERRASRPDRGRSRARSSRYGGRVNMS